MKSYDDTFSRSRRHLLLAGALVPALLPAAVAAPKSGLRLVAHRDLHCVIGSAR